eukprot:scaffold1372_cov183-Isochrysis_galbana.AAC.3
MATSAPAAAAAASAGSWPESPDRTDAARRKRTRLEPPTSAARVSEGGRDPEAGPLPSPSEGGRAPDPVLPFPPAPPGPTPFPPPAPAVLRPAPPSAESAPAPPAVPSEKPVASASAEDPPAPPMGLASHAAPNRTTRAPGGSGSAGVRSPPEATPAPVSGRSPAADPDNMGPGALFLSRTTDAPAICRASARWPGELATACSISGPQLHPAAPDRSAPASTRVAIPPRRPCRRPRTGSGPVQPCPTTAGGAASSPCPDESSACAASSSGSNHPSFPGRFWSTPAAATFAPPCTAHQSDMTHPRKPIRPRKSRSSSAREPHACSALVGNRVPRIPKRLLRVERKVLDHSRNVLRLHPTHVRCGEHSSQRGLLSAQVFGVPAVSRHPVYVDRRPQQDIGSLGAKLGRDSGAVGPRQRGVPRCTERQQARPRCRLPGLFGPERPEAVGCVLHVQGRHGQTWDPEDRSDVPATRQHRRAPADALHQPASLLHSHIVHQPGSHAVGAVPPPGPRSEHVHPIVSRHADPRDGARLRCQSGRRI